MHEWTTPCGSRTSHADTRPEGCRASCSMALLRTGGRSAFGPSSSGVGSSGVRHPYFRSSMEKFSKSRAGRAADLICAIASAAGRSSLISSSCAAGSRVRDFANVSYWPQMSHFFLVDFGPFSLGSGPLITTVELVMMPLYIFSRCFAGTSQSSRCS